jgi:membrane peptidoglycan carboxypeptidase
MNMIRDLENRTGVDRLEGFVLVAEQGKLRGMIGSTSLTGYNRTVEEFAPWSPGSTMKPYTYAEFFGAQGGSLTDRLPVQPRTFDLPEGGTWHPGNYSRRYDDHEPMAAGRALANSINVAAASLTVGPVGESLRRRLANIGYGDFAGHPSDVLGSRGVQPLRHFRLLQAFARPYGDIPEEGFALRRTEEVDRRDVWPQAAARKTARAMGLAVTEGTLSKGRRCCGWSARTHRGKTGTGQNHKAATLYVSRSGGVTVLMGVYSLGGARLTYQGRAGSVAGGSLIPYADRILQLSALRQTRGGSFDAIADL